MQQSQAFRRLDITLDLRVKFKNETMVVGRRWSQ